MSTHVPKIVITGGPCAAKTTSMAFLVQKLSDFGFYPILVREAATHLIDSRITPIGGVFSDQAFQRRVASLIVNLETEAEKAAQAILHLNPVIICDRGLLDGFAYVDSPEEMERWLQLETGLTRPQASARYKSIHHLRTAALGAEEFYTLSNNTARYETLEQARVRDQGILDAWTGHAKVWIIGNEGTLERKLKRLLASVCVVLGIPEPMEIERKFKLGLDIPLNKLGAYQEVDIEQFYLFSHDPRDELRLRKRVQHGEPSYFRTVKRDGPTPDSRPETDDFIRADDYEFGKQFQLASTRFVRKKRLCFVYDNQYFELDRFTDPRLDYAILEIELTDTKDEVRLPPFLHIEEEVTGNKAYGNRALANL